MTRRTYALEYCADRTHAVRSIPPSALVSPAVRRELVVPWRVPPLVFLPSQGGRDARRVSRPFAASKSPTTVYNPLSAHQHARRLAAADASSQSVSSVPSSALLTNASFGPPVTSDNFAPGTWFAEVPRI